jgi:hypothetical protein
MHLCLHRAPSLTPEQRFPNHYPCTEHTLSRPNCAPTPPLYSLPATLACRRQRAHRSRRLIP